MSRPQEYLKELIDTYILSDGLFNDQKVLYCFENIHSVDNVDANVYLSFGFNSIGSDIIINRQRYLTCTLTIEVDGLDDTSAVYPLVNTEDRYFNYDLEICEIMLNKIKEQLSIVKFNKMHSRFTFSKTIDVKLVDFVSEDNPNITKYHDNCCVCMEGTLKRTFCCNGYLCIPCNMKIVEIYCENCLIERDMNCENINCMKRPCPLCREKLKLYDNEFN